MEKCISLETIASSNQGSSISDTRRSCAIEGCKRKHSEDCYYRMCFTCCYEQDKDEVCMFHMKAREARKTKERYIEEGLQKINQVGRKRKKLDHPAEELFTDYNQTVLIWCFTDFVRNRKISEDTFTRQEKEDHRIRRARGEYIEHIQDKKLQHAPVKVKESTSQKCHRVRNRKFSRVKKQWCDRMKIPSELPGWLKETDDNRGLFCFDNDQKSPKKGRSSSSRVNRSPREERAPKRRAGKK